MTRLDQAARSARKARPATLVAGGVTAAVFFIPADIVDALTRPDYNPLRHWVSHLSLGEYGWVGTGILIVTSASLMAYTAGLHRLRADLGGSRGYPVAITVSAAGLALATLFPMDPSLGFPPGAETGISLAGSIHNIAGPLFIGALATAAFLSHRFLRSLGVVSPHVRWGLLSAGRPGLLRCCPAGGERFVRAAGDLPWPDLGGGDRDDTAQAHPHMNSTVLGPSWQ